MPRAEFCLLGCVRSFLLVPPDSQFTFQRSVRSLQLSAREASGVKVCARICGSYFFILGFVSTNPEPGTRQKREDCADIFAIGPIGTRRNSHQDKIACFGGLPGEARGLHSRVHADTEEAELCATQSCSCAFDEFD